MLLYADVIFRELDVQSDNVTLPDVFRGIGLALPVIIYTADWSAVLFLLPTTRRYVSASSLVKFIVVAVFADSEITLISLVKAIVPALFGSSITLFDVELGASKVVYFVPLP